MPSEVEGVVCVMLQRVLCGLMFFSPFLICCGLSVLAGVFGNRLQDFCVFS